MALRAVRSQHLAEFIIYRFPMYTANQPTNGESRAQVSGEVFDCPGALEIVLEVSSKLFGGSRGSSSCLSGYLALDPPHTPGSMIAWG